MKYYKTDKLLENTLYAFISICLSIIVALMILLSSYYIHEYGHASFAIFYSMFERSNSLNFTFNYQNLSGFLVPQQTGVTFSASNPIKIGYGLSGVIFTTIFYSIIGILLLQVKRIREKSKVQCYLLFSYLTLVINSIVENYFCGTDLFNLSCPALKWASLSFWVLFLVFTYLFFASLIKRNAV